MFFIIRCLIEWTIWLIFADKRRWRELLPPAFFAALLGSISDHIINFYKLWDYHDTDNKINKFLIEVLNDNGIYIVSTYLFIQWLPQPHTVKRLLGYFFIWTTVTTFIEWIHVATGHMTYHKWWNMGWSYIFDWILFWIFYKYHEIFKLKKMTEE